MPLTKDFFESQQYSQPISQFVGDNNELYSSILSDRTKNYYQNMANYQLIDDWSKNMKILPQDELIKQDVVNRVKTGMQETIDKGDYESATKKISQLAHNVKSDPLVNRAENNYKARQEFINTTLNRVGKKPEEGGITEADARAIINYNDKKYQGAGTSSYAGESIGRIKSAREVADEISKNFKPAANGKLEYRGGSINDPFMEKFGFTSKTIDADELRNAINIALYGDREYMQSQRDLIKYHGLNKQPSMEEVMKLYPSLDKDKKKILDANGSPVYNTDAYKKEISQAFGKDFEQLSDEEINQFNSRQLENKQIFDDINMAADVSVLQNAKQTEYTPYLDRDWNKLYEMNQQKIQENYEKITVTEAPVQMGAEFDLKESENNLSTLKEFNTNLLGEVANRPDKKLTPEESAKVQENKVKIAQIESANDAIKTQYLNSDKSDKIFNNTSGNFFNNKIPYGDKFGYKTIGDAGLERIGLTRKDIINHLNGTKTINEKLLDTPFESNPEPVTAVVKGLINAKNYFKPTLRDVINDVSENLTDEASDYAKDNPVRYAPKMIHITTKTGKPTINEISLTDRWNENPNWMLTNPKSGKFESKSVVLEDMGVDEKNYDVTMTLNGAGTYSATLSLKSGLKENILKDLMDKKLDKIVLVGEPFNINAKQKEQDYAQQINVILGQNGYNVPAQNYYDFQPIPNYQVEAFTNSGEVDAYKTIAKVITNLKFGDGKDIIEQKFKNPNNFARETIDLGNPYVIEDPESIKMTISNLFDKSPNVESVDTPAYGNVKILPISFKQEDGSMKEGFIAQLNDGRGGKLSSLGVQSQGDGTITVASSIEQLVTAIGTNNLSLLNIPIKK